MSARQAPEKPYVVRRPKTAGTPLVVSIPHTGTFLPAQMVAQLASPAMAALPMTDWHLHDLYDFLPALGVTSIHATYSRFAVDLNRSASGEPLYPGRFETGLVAERTFTGEQIYAEMPSAEELVRRVRLIHQPYHRRLAALLDERRKQFGTAYLIDAHSVASTANLLHGPLQADIYLGDADGASCPAWMTELVERSLAESGWRVVRNNPYKGGYITRHYGDLPGTEALQIEMCQRLYMEEGEPALPRTDSFATTRQILQTMFTALLDSLESRSRGGTGSKFGGTV